MSPVEHRGLRRQRGGTLLGFMLGLVLGLAVAVVVALFITRAPVPFVNKTGRTDRVIEPKSVADAPDPNKPLQSKNRPAAPAAAPAPAAAEEPAPKGTDSAADAKAATAEPRPAEPKPGDARITESKPDPTKTPDPKSADAKAAETKAADPSQERSSFLLQAGAFRTLDDAESMRGKLALLGYEARVLSADVNGQTMYRVRVGPYPKVDDVNQIRSRLAENGIEAAVVRQR